MAQTTADPPRNRMGEQRSEYLRSRAEDPVAWWPWGEEALDRARREGKPIFLSSGYQTCKWCHTMARESFTDRLVAERLNEEFVCILLDREEHPEVDEIYMAATVAMVISASPEKMTADQMLGWGLKRPWTRQPSASV